ncbi:MAG: polysaccharide deacetylase family protein [Proteobacteria bacterium]|nr:MAG: polysaccharide deacetylase family protein [Pseudomonadota bacterium]
MFKRSKSQVLQNGTWLGMGLVTALTAYGVWGYANTMNRNPSAAPETCRFESGIDSGHVHSALHPTEAQSTLVNYYRGFSLGERLKSDFDSSLARGVSASDLYSSNTYAQLMTLRSDQEERLDQLLHHYEADLNEEIQLGQKPAQLLERIREIEAELASLASQQPFPKTAQLAFSSLVEELELGVKRYELCLNSKNHSEQPVGGRTADLGFARLEMFKRTGLFRAVELETRSAQHAVGSRVSNSPEVTLEASVRERAFVTQADLKEIFGANRVINEAMIRPSVGPSGNLTGMTFPRRTWAMTYDDGPGKTTPLVLDNLKKLGAKATFFVLSQNVADGEMPETALRAQREGHAMASHSFTHANMPKMSAATQHHEIHDALNAFANRFGFRTKYYRLPYGAGMSNRAIRTQLANENVIHVFWNVDTLDWQDKNPDSIVERAKSQMKNLNRGIILFHDIHTQSVIASNALIKFMQTPEQAIRLVTLPEIVDELNGVSPTP